MPRHARRRAVRRLPRGALGRIHDRQFGEGILRRGKQEPPGRVAHEGEGVPAKHPRGIVPGPAADGRVRGVAMCAHRVGGNGGCAGGDQADLAARSQTTTATVTASRDVIELQ